MPEDIKREIKACEESLKSGLHALEFCVTRQRLKDLRAALRRVK